MKKRVLYAEDEFTNRRLLQIYLESKGIECDIVENGLEALEFVKKKSYDLIILDHYMPGLNGIETYKKINEINSKLPILAITSDDDNIEELKRVGFKKIYIKPIQKEKVLNSIEEFIQN